MTAWTDHAACIGATPLFFPVAAELYRPDRGRRNNPSIAVALAVCDRCPVETECLAHALDNDEIQGIWGGTTPAERAWLRRFAPNPYRRKEN
ncbi:MAG: WhiB family transcriptional regulator [Actinomycetota bacterium]|nr:WhiB family transcriptional regulator [Actinomycetota bacterium]